MTIRLSDLGQVYLVCGKTDMRQGIDSLAYLVKSHFNLDPFSGQVYLFCGGRKDRFKALYWDGQGFWLLYKRFENGKLTWPNNEEEVKALTSDKRKKAKGVRQAIFSQFTPEIIHHELQGEDCTCPDCHGQLKEIGSTVQRQELVFIPAQLKRIDHVQHAYKCQACSQKNLSDKIIKAPVPKAPLAHSLGSASIIAHTIHQKFTLKVPNYRQEED